MQAIRDLYRNYGLAWETGDAELWLSIWDEDGTQLPAGSPLRGKDAMRSILSPQFKPNMVATLAIELDEINVLGAFAFARGRFTCDYTEEYALPPEGGKFLSILKRQKDDSWKFYIDCSNSDAELT